jgi:hypothetical protein
MWDRGVLNASSWHGLEEVGTFEGAASLVDHGERSGAWPVLLGMSELTTGGGLVAPMRGVVAGYREHADRCVGVVGAKYHYTAPDAWRGLCEAACTAGAKPTGAFSLCDGAKMLATFEVGTSNGLRTQLLIADSYDGSVRLSAGFTTIRVVCANTLAAAFSADGKGMARLSHTASLSDRVAVLARAIDTAVKSGDRMRDVYRQASERRLTREAASSLFDALWPVADAKAAPAVKARAEGKRDDALRAMRRSENDEGPTLATLWNAATWLVDREADGSTRTHGDSDGLNAMLFGARGRRVDEIRRMVEVVLRDGTVQPMTVVEAQEHGVATESIVADVLADLMA